MRPDGKSDLDLEFQEEELRKKILRDNDPWVSLLEDHDDEVPRLLPL